MQQSVLELVMEWAQQSEQQWEQQSEQQWEQLKEQLKATRLAMTLVRK